MNKQKDCGRYENSNPYALSPFGHPVLFFEDAGSVISEEGFHRERGMVLDGKRFQIRSVFPTELSANPTEKLLRLIDSGHSEKKK